MALFGIKKIEYCRANELAFSSAYNPFFGVASEPLNEFTTICDLAKNRATLSIEQQIVSKQVLYTARLQFVTDADPLLAADYYAFVVTTNAGERILIGAQSRPRTMVTTAQSVGAAAGDLTAYTTTVEWQTNYRPVRLPMAAPVPISGPQYDICCGRIVGQEPVTLLTVIWQNYDGTQLDRQTYNSDQPEPTTSVVPTRPGTAVYSYTFSGWAVYEQTSTTKIYRAQYTAFSWRNVNPNLDIIDLSINVAAAATGLLISHTYDGVLWNKLLLQGNPAQGSIVNPNALVTNDQSKADLLATSFDFVDTSVFDKIYDNQLAIGYKYQNTVVPDWVKSNVGLNDRAFAAVGFDARPSQMVQFHLFVSFDGNTVQHLYFATDEAYFELYFASQPCYIKAIAYNATDYEVTLPVWQSATVTPIISDVDTAIGYYTSDWHGDI